MISHCIHIQDDKDDEEMYLFKFPSHLPMKKPSATSANGKEKVESSSGSKKDDYGKDCCTLADLPAGTIGKLLIYKSGAVRMKIGDLLFDVSKMNMI